MVKDDVVMSCRVHRQVRDEIECYSMDNFRKLYEEIDFPLQKKQKTIDVIHYS